MRRFDHSEILALAKKIQDARHKGNRTEEAEYVRLFNELLESGQHEDGEGKSAVLVEQKVKTEESPAASEASPKEAYPSEEISPEDALYSASPVMDLSLAPEQLDPRTDLAQVNSSEDITSEVVRARDELLADLKKEVHLFESYPEEIEPLLKNLLEEVAYEIRVPAVVLLPQFIEEWDKLVARKTEEEPLLQKLPELARLRSIFNRYQEELVEVLKNKN